MKYRIQIERDAYKKLVDIEIDLEDDAVGAIDTIKHSIFQILENVTRENAPTKAVEKGGDLSV